MRQLSRRDEKYFNGENHQNNNQYVLIERISLGMCTPVATVGKEKCRGEGGRGSAHCISVLTS